jgi:hypothetical protein
MFQINNYQFNNVNNNLECQKDVRRSITGRRRGRASRENTWCGIAPEIRRKHFYPPLSIPIDQMEP